VIYFVLVFVSGKRITLHLYSCTCLFFCVLGFMGFMASRQAGGPPSAQRGAAPHKLAAHGTPRKGGPGKQFESSCKIEFHLISSRFVFHANNNLIRLICN